MFAVSCWVCFFVCLLVVALVVVGLALRCSLGGRIVLQVVCMIDFGLCECVSGFGF